jgi:hypothetical protein
MSEPLLRKFILQELSNLHPSKLERSSPIPQTVSIDHPVIGNIQASYSLDDILWARVEKLMKKLHLLGRGSTRYAFAAGSKKVIKAAINEFGLAQNKAEVEVYSNPEARPIVTKIYDHAKDYSWLVAESVRMLKTPEEFKQVTGFALNVFSDLMFNKSSSFENSINNVAAYYEEGEEFENLHELENVAHSKLAKTIFDLGNSSNIKLDDFAKLEHWGKTSDNRIVVLDYGYTEEIADEMKKARERQ